MKEFEYNKLFLSEMSDELSLSCSNNLKRCFQQRYPHQEPGKSKFAKDVRWDEDNIYVKKHVIQQMIHKIVDNTINHIRELRRKHRIVAEIKTVIVVGGFSVSTILQQHLKTSLPELTFIFPTINAAKAVLLGAVQFGIRPESIFARKSSHTYGIGQYRLFKDKEDDPSKLEVINGKRWCKDCFIKIIEEEQVIVYGKDPFKCVLTPLRPEQGEMIVPVFISTKNTDPKYTTDDGVELVGELLIDMTDGKLTGNSNMFLTIHMGAEFHVSCVNEKTKNKCMHKIQFETKTK